MHYNDRRRSQAQPDDIQVVFEPPKLETSFEEKIGRTASRLGITAQQVPRNIAIIMDGNGRWASGRGLPRFEGHRQGGKTVEKIARRCVDLGVRTLTLYSFSMENWKRPKVEVDGLMHLYARYLVAIRPTLMENNVRLVHLGRAEPLPDFVRDEIAGTVEQTGGNSGMVLALALNYSSRTELVDAVRKIARQCKKGELSPEQIDEDCISQNLYTAGLPDPDLLIRTANEMRVSNFLLWQISYCEFYVTKTLWPDFDEAEIDEAILAYARRLRRFGNVGSEAGEGETR